MIKIMSNKNEIIEFNGNMDLRIGQTVRIFGNKYFIDSVESTREHVIVSVIDENEWKNKTSIFINGNNIGHGTITLDKVKIGVNPFDR